MAGHIMQCKSAASYFTVTRSCIWLYICTLAFMGVNAMCLIVQVLSPQARMNDQQQQQAATDKLLQRAKGDAQHAQHALRTAQQDAAGPAGPPGVAGPFLRSPASARGLRDRASSGMLDTDSWAEPASVEVSPLNTGC